MKKGDIVTINYPENHFHEAQAEVLEVVDSVYVRLKPGRRYEYLFGARYGDKDIDGNPYGEVTFPACALTVDEDWTVENRAENLFKGMYHHIFTTKSDKSICMHEGCDHPADKRILINIWGSVYEVHVCEKHTESDGHCMDDWPFRSEMK
jgi:hypothetical protein